MSFFDHKKTIENQKKTTCYCLHKQQTKTRKARYELDYLDKGLDKLLLLDNVITQLRSYIYLLF